MDHVGTVAGGADADDDIAGLYKSLHLAGEDVFPAVVVADTGEAGWIGDEGSGGERPAFAGVASEQFLGEVEGVGGAAAIAHRIEPVTGREGAADGLRHRLYFREQR